jgi:polygalacturonase
MDSTYQHLMSPSRTAVGATPLFVLKIHHDTNHNFVVVTNQDDCLAINSGSNIVFENNQCSGGHGISIGALYLPNLLSLRQLILQTGSIATGKSVSGVTISGNTVTNSQNGLRIKIDADATDASVSDVTYSGNTISGISKYGVLITEVRPLPLHTSVQFW